LKTIFSIICIICFFAACKKNEYKPVAPATAQPTDTTKSTDTTKQIDTNEYGLILNPNVDKLIGTYNGTLRDYLLFYMYDYNNRQIITDSSFHDVTSPCKLSVTYTNPQVSTTQITVAFAGQVYYLSYTGSYNFDVQPIYYGGHKLEFYKDGSVYFYKEGYSSVRTASQRTILEGKWKK
jgi:hypothetical protein